MFFTAREIESQVNAFLDSAFEQAASTLGPVQVLVDPGDLQVCKISLHFLDPEPDCGSRVGGGARRKSVPQKYSERDSI